MQQSNIIAGFLFMAFLIYITLKGELPVYMGFLLSSAPASYAPPTASVAPVGASGDKGKGGGMPDFGGLPGGILGTVGNTALAAVGLPPLLGGK